MKYREGIYFEISFQHRIKSEVCMCVCLQTVRVAGKASAALCVARKEANTLSMASCSGPGVL